MLGVFWNPQDKQMSKLFLDLYFEQHLKEILRFITAAGAACHHCMYCYNLIVYLAWLYNWPDCLFDLTVYLTWVSNLTWLSIWPDCLFDLCVQFDLTVYGFFLAYFRLLVLVTSSYFKEEQPHYIGSLGTYSVLI